MRSFDSIEDGIESIGIDLSHLASKTKGSVSDDPV
jgi:hypothetical protein